MIKRRGWEVAILLSGSFAFAGGWHFGEIKDLNVEIEYFDYAFKAPDGTPVYFIGTHLRYRINLNNESNRTFNRFQAQSSLLYLENRHCHRWYYDDAHLDIKANDPLPGNFSSGWQEVSMRKTEGASYEIVYPISWEVCPGKAYIRIEGRHTNESGRDEAASFNIPLNFDIKDK